MRPSLVNPFVVATIALALGSSCADELPSGDVCADAIRLFAECGTSVPLLADGPCAGVRAATARCVLDHAHDCDELATLSSRTGACVADLLDAGAPLIPPDLPLPSSAATGGGGGSGGSGGSGFGGAGGQQI